jgi:hypothetical protein
MNRKYHESKILPHLIYIFMDTLIYLKSILRCYNNKVLLIRYVDTVYDDLRVATLQLKNITDLSMINNFKII